MPRTVKQQEEAAAAAEEWLNRLDPDEVPGKDAAPLRELRQRFEDYAIAGRRLAEAVSVARGYGFSWGTIGMVLGISKQAARARFGKGGEGDRGGRDDPIPDERELRALHAQTEQDAEAALWRAWHAEPHDPRGSTGRRQE